MFQVGASSDLFLLNRARLFPLAPFCLVQRLLAGKRLPRSLGVISDQTALKIMVKSIPLTVQQLPCAVYQYGHSDRHCIFIDGESRVVVRVYGSLVRVSGTNEEKRSRCHLLISGKIFTAHRRLHPFDYFFPNASTTASSTVRVTDSSLITG